jgi:hypothetical protein
VTIAPIPETSQPVPTDDVELTVIPGGQSLPGGEVIDLAVRLIDDAGVVEVVSSWKESDRKGPGGRPETFPVRALLVALAVCVLTEQPVHATVLTDVMFRQLDAHRRSLLGIPDPPDPGDALAWDAAYRNVRTRLHGILNLVDPSPYPKNRRLDPEEFAAMTEARRGHYTEEEWAERSERLAEFVNRLLEASIKLLPREIRRAWRGSVGVDATVVPAFARAERREPGPRRRSDAPIVRTHSADPDAAWYVREGDHREEGATESGRGALRKIFWGYEATLVVSGPDDPADPAGFPSLVMGMAPLHKPGHDVGANAVRALGSVNARGHPAHYLAADRAYSSAKAEDFQLPAAALGYQPVFDYKVDQLGVKAQYEGFLQVEGAWYCPSIPPTLVDATADFRAGRIDEATYASRLEERWRYLARAKAQPDVEGHVRVQCPAASSWPLARCELKPKSIRVGTGGRLRIIVKPDVAANPPPSCTQQSVTVPPEAGAKFRQPLLYASAEWKATYNQLRNANEGMNGYVKDPAHEALGDPGRRRIRGVAGQSVFVAFLLMAANVRKIRAYVVARAQTAPGGARRYPRRRKTRSIELWRPAASGQRSVSDPDPPLIA